MNRFCVISLVLLISICWCLPVIFGYLAAPSNPITPTKFLGWIRSDDFHRYGSFIDQTRYENRIFYMDNSAVEPQSPRMIASYFFILGLVGKILPLSAQSLWLISFFIALSLFMLILIKALNIWTPDIGLRNMALFLILFSGGLELLALKFGIFFPREKNFWMDGFSTFCSFHNPLKLAGIACVLWLLLMWKTYLETRNVKFLAITFLIILFSWSVHPNSAIPGYAALVSSIFSKAFLTGSIRLSFRKIIKTYLPLLIPFGIIGIYILWMQSDPTTAGIIKQYNIRNLVEPFRYYPLRYGLILPLGVVGFLMSIRKRAMLDMLMAGWWISSEMFAHISGMSGLLFQHMVHLPMALFASIPLVKLVRSHSFMKWLTLSLLGLSFTMQNTFVVLKVIDQTRQDVWPTSLYWSEAEVKAAEELRGYPRGNVLASRDSGNKIGWLALKPSFLGHWGTTPARREKELEFNRFFESQTSNAWRQNFLKRYHIQYIWYGPKEKKAGALDHSLPLTSIIEKDVVTIFRVNPVENINVLLSGP